MRLTTLAKLQSEVKRINTQLRALEKEGLATSSNWYNWVKRQEFSTVNVIGRTKKLTEQGKENLKLGKELTSNDYQFKLRTDITKMTPREIRKLKDMISFTKQAKTYTIKGTKEKIKKQYENYNKYTKTEGFDTLSFEEFNSIWKNEKFKLAVKKFGYSNTSEYIDYAQSKGLSLEEALETLFEESGSLIETISKAYQRLSDEDFKEIYNTDINNDDEFINIGYP